jgi:hypothetical protein
MSQWLYDYRITPRGFEIYLFGFLTVYILPPQNIVAASIVYGLWGGLDYGSHSFNTLSMGNRLRSKWVLVEKRRGVRFFAITPKNPNGFVRDVARLAAAAAS